MTRRGRPTSAAGTLDRLPGTPAAKRRVMAIIANVAGTLPTSHACRELSVSPSRMRLWRKTLLDCAVRALEPRPRGRPVLVIPTHVRRILDLEFKINQLEEELKMAHLREELALVVPGAVGRQKKRRAIRGRKPVAVPSGPPENASKPENPGSVSPPP